MANNSKYRTVAYDKSFEEDCERMRRSPREMDDYMRAAEFMAQRALAKEIEIPRIPGTDVYVFRLEGAFRDFPATRWYFRAESDDKAVFVAVEEIPEEEQTTE